MIINTNHKHFETIMALVETFSLWMSLMISSTGLYLMWFYFQSLEVRGMVIGSFFLMTALHVYSMLRIEKDYEKKKRK